jgi:hypothetical protein
MKSPKFRRVTNNPPLFTELKTMTDVIETVSAATSTPVNTAFDDLETLVSYLSKIQSQVSKALPTASLHPALKKAIIDLQKYLGIESDTFLKAVFSQSNFDSLKVPEIAKVDGKAAIIINNVVYSADSFFAKLKSNPKDFTFESVGEKKDSNISYSVSIETENEETSALVMRLWNDPETELDKAKLKKDAKYFTDSLNEYNFSLDALVDGEYPVQSWTKKGRAFIIRINNRNYYTKEKHVKNLESAKTQGKDTIFCLAGTAVANIDGKDITYRNTFVKGYESAQSLKDVCIKLIPDFPATKEILKEVVKDGAIILPEPLVLNVLGIGESTYTDKEGVEKQVNFLRANVNGQEYKISFISAFRRANDSGKFNVSSFDGYQIRITSVDYYNGYKFNLDWVIPSAIIPTDATLDKLAAELGF